MNAQTIAEKILSAKSGAPVRAGDIILASVDLAYSHDGNRPLAMDQLAEMGTKITAARLLNLHAASLRDEGRRVDQEAGMAKLFASEMAMEVTANAIRIHGGYGYSTEFDVERYYRDAPLMVVGEGTNEIQRTVIARQLIDRGGLGRL